MPVKVNVKAGQAVGGLQRVVIGVFVTEPCGHERCTRHATEGEAFRLRTPPGARYKTKLTWFWRCDKHHHSHWKQIGFGR
jgi:hypothetical protein